MKKINPRLELLFSRYVDRQASHAEEEEFRDYVNNPVFAEDIKLMIENIQVASSEPGLEYAEQDEMLKTIFKSEPKQIQTRRLWHRIAVAASIIGLIGTGIFFYYTKSAKDKQQITYQTDIAPGRNGATLTLGNGKKILINDAIAGNIANEAGVKISKTKDGQLVYEVVGTDDHVATYNTLATTRGEQSQVRLPDGSLVFLNAESSLRYPTSFAKLSKREVALSGEGYFEVAKDKTHPFVVQSGQQTVEVLGTHFNISSYQDEPVIRTTLLEGSVKVTPLNNPNGTVLRPDQQAVLSSSGLKVSKVDSEDAVAWKNGLFIFEDEALESIMKRVERWYDVEVVYEQGVDRQKKYGGSVSRFDKVSKILESMELPKGIHFKVEGRRITVMK